jgi:hypothetical protein
MAIAPKLALCRTLLAAPTPEPTEAESYHDRTQRLTGHALDICPRLRRCDAAARRFAAPPLSAATILVRQFMTNSASSQQTKQSRISISVSTRKDAD